MRVRARVAHGVGQRLLRDADDLPFDAVAESRELVDDDVDGHAGRCAGPCRRGA